MCEAYEPIQERGSPVIRMYTDVIFQQTGAQSITPAGPNAHRLMATPGCHCCCCCLAPTTCRRVLLQLPLANHLAWTACASELCHR